MTVTPRRWAVPAITATAVAGVAALALLGSLATAPSGAFWVATASASATGTAGPGQWCAPPNPSPSATPTPNPAARIVPLSSLATTVGSYQMAIIPVANNAAWGGDGTKARALGVNLWTCQDGTGTASPAPAALADGVRVTAWSNPSGTLPTVGWLSSSPTQTAAPTSRLDPTVGLGLNIANLAKAASVSASNTLGVGSGDARRLSWIVSSGRTLTAATAAPGCSSIVGLLTSCSLTLTNSSNQDSTLQSTFNVSPWTGSTITPAAYAAQTSAVQQPTGWAAGTQFLTQSCVTVLLCSTTSAATVLNPTTATAVTTTDGNALQWVVIQWSGGTAPPPDVEVEITLTPTS
jgi:hypothetical protein